jgi:hypothetical protein
MAANGVKIDTAPQDGASDNEKFLDRLRAIVGPHHVLTTPESTRRYRKGFRFGVGPALAVVRPGSLIEQWRVLKACAAATFRPSTSLKLGRGWRRASQGVRPTVRSTAAETR